MSLLTLQHVEILPDHRGSADQGSVCICRQTCPPSHQAVRAPAGGMVLTKQVA
jgi:hypothetical protein